MEQGVAWLTPQVNDALSWEKIHMLLVTPRSILKVAVGTEQELES